MQKNPAVKTIEGDLEKALFQTGRISAANYGSLAKVSWQRCARTDKGVSAQGQIVSLKVALKSEDVWTAYHSLLSTHLRTGNRKDPCRTQRRAASVHKGARLPARDAVFQREEQLQLSHLQLPPPCIRSARVSVRPRLCKLFALHCNWLIRLI